MGYVGNKPALNYTTFAVQHFTTSATTGYTLDNAVTNENDIRLVINNVVQQPGGSYAYTASGTTLTLSAATTTSDTMYCVFLGKAVQTVNPGAGSVGTSQLATDAVTQVKMADDSVGTAEILDTNVTGAKLNDDVISGQGALGAAPADTDEFLVSDAGVLKRVDYSYIKGITQTSFLPDANPIIINGDMAISQRSTSVSTASSGYHCLDRWRHTISGTGTWTITQESLSSTDPPVISGGFGNALKMDCTTDDASIGSGDSLYIAQRFEGQDIQLFRKGSSGALSYTVSFWVKATKTGTNIVELYDNDNSRQCCVAYTVSSTNTWEHKVVNLPADTAGTLDNNNAYSMAVNFWMAAGSSFTSGTLSTTWASSTDANKAVGQVNNADSTSNNFHITGVQLEVGEYTSSDLPPFRHESYGDNLQRCQRYYQLHDALNGAYSSSSSVAFIYQFTGEMRAIPSGTVTAALQVSNNVDADYTQTTPGVTMYSGRVSKRGALSQGFNFPTLATPEGRMYNTHPVVSGSIALSAEL